MWHCRCYEQGYSRSEKSGFFHIFICCLIID